VRLVSGCGGRGCRRTVRAQSNGAWRARLALVASRRRPRARFRVSSSVPGPPRRRVVRLHAVRAAAPTRSARPAKVRAPALPPLSSLPPASTTASGHGSGATRRLVLIGDSLAVGIQNLLPSLLPGWTVRADALTGRPLTAGLRLIEAADLRSQPTVLAVSLFTNDDPRAVAALAGAVQRSVSLVGPHGCAIWATVVRPRLRGVPYTQANRTLLQLAAQDDGALLVVPWAAQVALHPSWLGADHVHATSAGYLARAQMYAQAAQACNR
jgi:hypothetical protein